MTKRSIARALRPDVWTRHQRAAAGPELSVGASCDTDRIGGGAAVTVPITFRAGTGDAGLPNGVSAIDFAVTFAADAFTVSDVRLRRAGARHLDIRLGAHARDFRRRLDAQASRSAPEFQFPLPTLPDGPIAELVLVATRREPVPADRDRPIPSC